MSDVINRPKEMKVMKARSTEVDKQQKEEYFITTNKEIQKEPLNLGNKEEVIGLKNSLESVIQDQGLNLEEIEEIVMQKPDTKSSTGINIDDTPKNNKILENMQESIKNIESKLESKDEQVLTNEKVETKDKVVSIKSELSYYFNYILLGLLIPSMVNSCTYAMLFLITKPFTEIATEVTMSWLTLTMSMSYFLAIAFTFFYSLKHSIKLAFNHKADVKLKLASGFSILLSVLLPIFPIFGTIIAWNIFGSLINMTILADTQGIVIDNLGQLFGIIQSSSFVDLYVYLNNFLTTICFMEPGDILTFEYIKSQL